jgi:hypothetical protein
MTGYTGGCRFLLDSSKISILCQRNISRLHSLYNLLEDIAERTRMMTRWCEVVESDNLPILPVLDAAERCGE